MLNDLVLIKKKKTDPGQCRPLPNLKEYANWPLFENRVSWTPSDFEKIATGVIYAKNKKKVLNSISGFWSYTAKIWL